MAKERLKFTAQLITHINQKKMVCSPGKILTISYVYIISAGEKKRKKDIIGMSIMLMRKEDKWIWGSRISQIHDRGHQFHVCLFVCFWIVLSLYHWNKNLAGYLFRFLPDFKLRGERPKSCLFIPASLLWIQQGYTGMLLYLYYGRVSLGSNLTTFGLQLYLLIQAWSTLLLRIFGTKWRAFCAC